MKNLVTRALVDREAISVTMRLLIEPGGVTELRALEATTQSDSWPRTWSGYFDDSEKLAAAASQLRTSKGIYLVPNPVEPALLARAANRLRKTPRGESTSDANITCRRWLLIDCDAARPSGISSTHAEHTAALDRMRQIDLYLHDAGFPEGVHADSGNGAHLMYRLDLPADDDGLVKRFLEWLASKFDDDVVHVDTGVFNPARIWKLYGTLACKGDDTPDRPHRMAQLISIPPHLKVVPKELLESLTGESQAEQDLQKTSRTRNRQDDNNVEPVQKFDLPAFLSRHNLDIDGPEPWSGQQGQGLRWTFNRSPLCDHHADGPYLIQHASGAITAACHHNSCDWQWADLCRLFEPNEAKAKTRIRDQYAAPPDPPLRWEQFPVSALPQTVAEFVQAASQAIGCDASYIALPLLACLARAIGNTRVIRLKRTWTEPAIVWAAIIGKSGTHKTPSLQAAMQFIDRKQKAAIEKHVEALAGYSQDLAEYDRAYVAWKRSKSEEPPPWKPEEPVCNRYITSDCTIEALAALLAVQNDGLLVSRDELAGWLNGIAEYKGGQGSDLGHWLACWSAQSLTVDRKTGAIKMINVPRAAVSLVGGIQPAVLRRAIGREHMQDGLCARLLMAMPDPRPVVWTDAIVDLPTEQRMSELFDKLLTIEPAANEHGEPEPFPLDLTPGAKAMWVDYFNRHRSELVELDDDLAAAWSKLEAYAARFALIFQLCGWAAGNATDEAIEATAMEAAIELSDWFGGEAKRVYGMFCEDEADQQQRELIEMIQRRGGSITARELAHAARQYRKAGESDAALQLLADAGLGKWEVQPTSGRPRNVFKLTPVTVTEASETAA